MAPPQQLRQQTCNCSLLLIYRPIKDERLSWPGWLTYSGWLTHISGHPSATGWAQDSKSTPVKDRLYTAGPSNQSTIPAWIFLHSIIFCFPWKWIPRLQIFKNNKNSNNNNYIVQWFDSVLLLKRFFEGRPAGMCYLFLRQTKGHKTIVVVVIFFDFLTICSILLMRFKNSNKCALLWP